MAHLSFALFRSTNAASQFVLVTFCTITNCTLFVFSISRTESFWTAGRRFFLVLSFVWSKNLVSIMDIDVIIRSYFVQSIGTKSSNNESSKGNSKDERLCGNGLTEKMRENFLHGSRWWSDFIEILLIFLGNYLILFALKWHNFQWIGSKLWYPIRVRHKWRWQSI